MPGNISNIFTFLILALWLFVLIIIAVRAVRNKYAPVKTVKAVVIDKHKTETFSKYSGTGKSEKYVIVFSAGGKKLSFYVSEFSYGGYRIKETGTLKYKGNRIIDFS